MERARIHVVVTGIVQGVCYRAYARDEARSLGLVGWVKNRYNGSVEAVAEGSKDGIEKFIEWCRNGPPSAVVENVEVEYQQTTREFKEFRIVF